MATKKAPRINWMKALFLERKEALSWRFDELADATGYSGNYVQSMFKESPSEWPASFRAAIVKLFGISEQELEIVCILTMMQK